MIVKFGSGKESKLSSYFSAVCAFMSRNPTKESLLAHAIHFKPGFHIIVPVVRIAFGEKTTDAILAITGCY